jgi:predicted amidophosphoribosyltransferase
VPALAAKPCGKPWWRRSEPVESRVLAQLLDLVFPPKCLGCERRGVALCIECRGDLPFLPPDVCYRCAARRGARGTCRGCRQLSPALSSVRAPFAYEGAARGAVLALKFRSGRYLVPLMADFLGQALGQRPVAADLVVPVPLAPRRLRQRGFNQASLLATEVAKVLGADVAEVLERAERPAQQTLGAAARLENLNGAIRCSQPNAVHGRQVILVDDVVTTSQLQPGALTIERHYARAAPA